ncbi:MAG TPA: integrin alpha, partial [Solirubrobacteraceae bacterium]|nr:integrin alpha [Solirubrobacteraceae bacterium]
VALGDLDGGGAPDIVVGASRYTESPATAFPGSHCASTPGATCVGAGRAYVYRGEDVAGSNPSVTLDAALRTLRNPAAQADDPAVADVTARRELYANAITAVGDVGSCTTPAIPAGNRCPFSGISTTLDGRPEFLVSAFRADLPMNDPDGSMPDTGVNFLYDGATGAILTTYHHPEPQAGATFGTGVGGPPVGDLGGDTTRADVYIPAVTQNGVYKGQGRGYVMSGDLNAFTSTLNFALLDDPTPAPGGNFGAGYAALGDVVTQSGKFRNELLVGAGHLGEPGNAELVNDIHVFDPLKSDVLQTIVDPDAEPGSRFGADLATLGDLNGDGFVDLLASALAWDGPAGVAQGRIYILRSDNSPAPQVPAPPAPPPPPIAPAPPPPSVAVTLTGRTIELVASRETMRRRQRLTLRGRLEAFANPAACEARQGVQIQRRPLRSVTFRTFATRRTSATGTFSLATRPAATYVYRARVAQSGDCHGAVSNRERVRVVRR